MAQLIEYVDELIREVGPRPAGTQQEHQAAELIAARLDEFGMKVDIEEFPCARNIGWVRVLYYALCVIGAVVSILFADFRVIGVILIAVGVIFMLLDFLGKNPLFTLFKNSLSQNVIARYLPPGNEPSSRNRKMVILAHYDSARTMVQAAPPLVPYYAQLRRAIRVAMIAMIVFALLTLIPFPPIVLTVLSVLVGIMAAVVLLAFLGEVVNLFMPYNQGANCNGSSVGVLYGLAQILSSGVDVATLRKASGLKGESRPAREDGMERASRQVAASERGESRRSRRGTRVAPETSAASEAGAGALTTTMGGLLSRLQGKGRSQTSQSVRSDETTPVSQDIQDSGQPSRQEVPARHEGQANAGAPAPQVKTSESSVRSVGDSLANPFISQRPPLSEIEEVNRLREEERERRMEEQRKRAQEEDRTEDGVPLWFVKAKQNAEKKVERRQRDSDKTEVVRSRFADVPTSGRLQREEHNVAEQQVTAQQAQGGGVSVTEKQPDGQPVAAGGAAVVGGVVAGGAAALVGGGVAGGGAAAAGDATASGQGVPGEKAARASAADVADAYESTAASLSAVSTSGWIERPRPIVRSEVSGSFAQPAQGAVPAQLTQGTTPAQGAQGATSAQSPQPAQGTQSTHAESAQFAQPTRRQTVPVTVAPDFSGLDRQAFKVLPDEENEGNAVIVPGQGKVAVEDDVLFDDDALAFEADIGGNRQGELFPATARTDGQGRAGKQNRLLDLPTLSMESTGNIPLQQAGFDVQPVAREELFSTEDSVVSATGSFVPLGTTGVMKPVGGELLSYNDEGEIYIHDADDTAISEHYSQTGEYSEPELVNIPESRVKSFLGSVGDRLSGKKKEKLENSPATWLGVDERFDARKEGSAIGSWENFSDDEDWNGGAYGGAGYEENVKAVVNLSHELLDKEVWLVALGANESKNAGLANLFANHGNELKSALFINLLGVGVGDLVFTVSEGNYRPAQTDHRMQNLISSAAQSMAIPIGPVKFSAFGTDCTETLKRGGRAISIMGLKKRIPVGWRWSDDEVSRLREDNLSDTAALIIETIKNS
jgi:hypothetical protein